uniref:Growth factor receptor bound protein 7 n=1 Tax=Nothoprocta perdicaria TaxID=30464 RepID=A0A8C6ZI99_NOTPE
MDGGAQPSSPPEPPGAGGTEQDGAPGPPQGVGERDAGEGPPAADIRRSQPLLIQASRWVGGSRCVPDARAHPRGVWGWRGGSHTLCARSRTPAPDEPRASSLPSIPNPFPELCSPSNSPILSSPGVGQGPPRDGATHVVKVFSEDGACRALAAPAGTTARQLCEMLVQRAQALHDQSWALVELHPHLGLERCLEDHEAVLEVQDAWAPGADSRFVFRKNFAKYELFRSNGQSLFPEVMVSSCLEANKSMPSPLVPLQNFLNSGSCPEVQGFLQLREPGRKVWKRFHFSLRRSGLYYSTKGTSKDPRHLQYFADLTESNIYYVTQGKKLYGAPTEFGFCIKPCKARSGTKGLKLLCSEDEQSRTCWVAAFRLFKVSPAWPRPPPPQRSVSDNALVAMDFSGCTGRVLESPGEALTAALEEAQAWRVRGARTPGGVSGGSPGRSIHRTQPWFHGRLSREDTQQLIGRQGLVDGVFLVRESQRNPKGFVLSLCHLQKVKHYLILPSEEEGRLYFTMDDGQTRFADLIQLVEFHQINRGILPCKLRHYCTCVAL